MDWDWIVAVLIIAGLILTIWAKVSKQTIRELFEDISDFIRNKKEDTEEKLDLVYYD